MLVPASIVLISRKLLFCPAAFFDKAIRDEFQRAGGDLIPPLLYVSLKSSRRLADAMAEKSGKRAETVKTDGETRVLNGCTVGQHYFRAIDPNIGQILVGCFAVAGLKQSDEVKF